MQSNILLVWLLSGVVTVCVVHILSVTIANRVLSTVNRKSHFNSAFVPPDKLINTFDNL